MTQGRAVRIPTRRPSASVEPQPDAGTVASEGGPDGPFDPNRFGTMRAYRLFLLFVAVTLLTLVVLLILLATSPTPGVRDDPLDYGLFVGIGLAMILASYALTMLPTPRGVRRSGGELLVTERTGRVRRLRADPKALRPLVLRRYGAGPLNERPVVLLEVAVPDGTRRAYLVDEGLLDESTSAD